MDSSRIFRLEKSSSNVLKSILNVAMLVLNGSSLVWLNVKSLLSIPIATIEATEQKAALGLVEQEARAFLVLLRQEALHGLSAWFP